ncbi:MAG: sulfotransferase [Pseudomonadota bacterium]
MQPDFLIIGAEKAGTTWLHDVLGAHPALFLPDVKEIHYFNRFDSNGNEIDNFTKRGQQWYQTHFAKAAEYQITGEATPMYLCDPEAPARIYDTLPDARFIVTLREPVSRAWSHYRMARAKAHIDRDLDELIANRDANVLGRGLYAVQLQRWFEFFSRDRFLILFFEDIIADPAPSLRRIASWLGVDADPLLSAEPEKARNAATGYRSAGFYNFSVKAARAMRNTPLTRGLASQMKAVGIYDMVKKANRTSSENLTLSDDQRNALAQFYRRDRKALQKLIGQEQLPWVETDAAK